MSVTVLAIVQNISIEGWGLGRPLRYFSVLSAISASNRTLFFGLSACKALRSRSSPVPAPAIHGAVDDDLIASCLSSSFLYDFSIKGSPFSLEICWNFTLICVLGLLILFHHYDRWMVAGAGLERMFDL